MRLRRLLLPLLILALVAAACGGGDDAEGAVDAEDAAVTEESVATTTVAPETTTTTAAPETTTTTTTTTTTEAPLPGVEPIGDGPYAVGVQTITVEADHREAPITVDVWFPLVDDVDATAARYAFVTGDYFDSPRALDAGFGLASPDGPFPMVVYSHGSGGIRFIHSDYTETIASHGYVVVAPDHAGNTAVERVLGNADPADLIAYNRPLDIIAVIDGVLADADVSPLVDGESIAVTGHSFGGFTTYAVASGTDNPNGVTPADPRVDALIPLAPAVGDGAEEALLTAAELGSIEIPTLIIVGTDDKTTPVVPNVETAWNESVASPHYRVELVAGEHQSFTDLCDYLEVVPDREDANPLVVGVITEMSV
ncbi:MAG: dienelactone hydrolase family protein, partial [Actinomycetota bacterium]